MLASWNFCSSQGNSCLVSLNAFHEIREHRVEHGDKLVAQESLGHNGINFTTFGNYAAPIDLAGWPPQFPAVAVEPEEGDYLSDGIEQSSLTALNERWNDFAASEMFEGDVLFSTWYLSHLHHRSCHQSRPVVLDRNTHDWFRIIVSQWLDRLDRDWPVEIYYVQPDPPEPNFLDASAGHILVVQHGVPGESSVLHTTIPIGTGDDVFPSLAIVAPSPIGCTQIVTLAGLEQLCGMVPSTHHCRCNHVIGDIPDNGQMHIRNGDSLVTYVPKKSPKKDSKKAKPDAATCCKEASQEAAEAFRIETCSDDRLEHQLCSSHKSHKFPLSKEQYSKQVCKDGFYMGWGDVAVHADQNWHEVAVLCWDDNDEGLLPLGQRLKTLTGDDFGSDQVPDLSSLSTWIFAWTRADYQKGPFQSLNHALPMFHRKLLEDEFDKMTETMMSKLDQRIKKIRMQINLFEDEEEDDTYIKASLEDALAILEKKHIFFKEMIARDLMPEIADLWLQKSSETKWQLLFRSLSLHEEIPMIQVQEVKDKFDSPSMPQSSAPASQGCDPGSKKRSLEETSTVEDSDKSKKSKVDTVDKPETSKSQPSRVSQCRPAAFGQPRDPESVLKPSGHHVHPKAQKDPGDDDLSLDSEDDEGEKD
eukprot:s1840_g8.t1